MDVLYGCILDGCIGWMYCIDILYRYIVWMFCMNILYGYIVRTYRMDRDEEFQVVKKKLLKSCLMGLLQVLMEFLL